MYLNWTKPAVNRTCGQLSINIPIPNHLVLPTVERSKGGIKSTRNLEILYLKTIPDNNLLIKLGILVQII